MSCNITSGFTLGCRDNTGGVKRAYIYGGDDTLDITFESGSISDISGSGTWYTFDQVRETSTFTDSFEASTENQTIVYTQTLELMFHKMEGDRQNFVQTVAKNPDLRIIVETQNGQDQGGVVAGNGRYFMMGQVNGASAISDEGGTGKAFGDANGITVTFEAKEPLPAHEITTDLDGLTNLVIA